MGSILIGDRKSVKPMTEIITEGINVDKVKNELLKEDFDLKKLLSKK